MIPRQLLLAALVPLVGCATSSQQTSNTPTPTPVSAGAAVVTPPPAPAFAPAGTYSYTTELNGSPLTGNAVIKGASGVYTGVLTAEGQGEFPMSGIKVDGRTVSFNFDTPNGTGTGKFNFTSNVNEFTGTWELAGQTGVFKGKRTN